MTVRLEDEYQPLAGQRASPDGQSPEVLRADGVGPSHVQGEVQGMQVAVVLPHPGLVEPPALHVLPLVEVLLRERGHRRNPGGSRRGRHEDHVLLGDGAEKPEERALALGVPLGQLVDEREFHHVGERLEVRRLHPRLVERFLVVRRVLVGELQLPFELGQLELLELGAGHGLDLRPPVFPVVGMHRNVVVPFFNFFQIYHVGHFY